MIVSVEEIQKLSPDDFELLIARLLVASGFANVVPIGGTGDEGIDLRAEWAEKLPTGDVRMTLWAVQCKRYSSPLSPKEVKEILDAALEPAPDTFPLPPDFFLLATSSGLTTAARRIVERANRQRSKYDCRFLVWDGDTIAAKISKYPEIGQQFFAAKTLLLPRPQPISVIRLTVLLDKMDDRAIMTFLYDSQGTGPVSLMAKTELAESHFEQLVRHSQQLASEVISSTYLEDNEQFLRATGKTIYGLIPAPIKSALFNQGDVYVRLASNIHLVPFEIAYDEHTGSFLGSVTRIGRIQVSAVTPPRTTWAKPAILLLGAVKPVKKEGSTFPDLPLAEKELKKLQRLLSSQGFTVQVVSGSAVTRESLHQILEERSYQVIHFSGHGLAQLDGRAGILLADGIASYDEIFAHPIHGSLVVLSACSSGPVLNDISKLFFANGAIALIGFIGPVTDEAANILALKFYEEMVQGETLGTAMRKARELQRATRPRDLSWASFVLFGDPTLTVSSS